MGNRRWLTVLLMAIAFGAGYYYAESNRPACTPGQAISDWFWSK